MSVVKRVDDRVTGRVTDHPIRYRFVRPAFIVKHRHNSIQRGWSYSVLFEMIHYAFVFLASLLFPFGLASYCNTLLCDAREAGKPLALMQQIDVSRELLPLVM